MSNKRRPQTPKPRNVLRTSANVAENKDWMRARLSHSNRNNTVPSGKKYSRKVKYRASQYS